MAVRRKVRGRIEEGIVSGRYDQVHEAMAGVTRNRIGVKAEATRIAGDVAKKVGGLPLTEFDFTPVPLEVPVVEQKHDDFPPYETQTERIKKIAEAGRKIPPPPANNHFGVLPDDFFIKHPEASQPDVIEIEILRD